MHVAVSPERYAGRVVGHGSCALYVQRVSKVGLTRGWRRGGRVRGNNVPVNTIIATFVPDGRGRWRYANKGGGTAHAAVYISQDARGIQVWDQWIGRPVAQRTIVFRGGSGRPVDDGDAYFTVLT